MATVKLVRGDTWDRTWIITDEAGAPLDLTGATARLHVRDGADALMFAASTANGHLTITPAAGRIDMRVPKELTGIAPGTYRFDLEVTYPDGRRYTYEQAALAVLTDYTRD